MRTIRNLFFTRLSAANPQPFDGISAGDFIDSIGRPLTIRREDLATIVANTRANIAATVDAAGDVVGLPIDTLNHNHGEAAGYIVDAALDEARGVITFTPRWNEEGRELIGGDKVRYFSPEIDLREKVALGGSLTNYPATRDRKQKHMLRPVTLSASLSVASMDESLDEESLRKKRCFSEWANNWYTWALEVFDDYMVVIDEDQGKYFKVPYTEDKDGNCAFADRGEWTEMRRAWVEMAMHAAREFLAKVFNGPALPADTNAPAAPAAIPQTSNPEGTMFDISKLSAEERQAAITALFSGSNPPAELAAIVNTRAAEMAASLLAAEQRKQAVASLSTQLTGGTAEAQRGLPLSADEITALLSEPTAEKVEAALKTIQAKGLVEFGERGHNQALSGQHELPAEYAAKLDSGALTLTDLANPALDLGDLAQYNLSKWQKKE